MTLSPRGSLFVALLALALPAGTGCRSIGPKTIPGDRYDYSSSISESWKRQTLLNIIKLRYCDPPIFVDVGQIVAGYSLETSTTLGGQVSSAGAMQGNSLNLGGAAKYTDRPTVTYTPLTGDKFVKALMTPLPPESVFFTIESGWPADAILFLTTKRLNRLRNQEASIAGLTKAEPRFLRALELLRKLQDADAMGMRIEQDPQKRQSTIVTFYPTDISESALADCHELRNLLGLAPEANEFKLLFGAIPANNRELAMQTRSPLHIMMLLAAQVEVPTEHVAQGLASQGIREANQEGSQAVSFARILSSKSKPTAPYVAVQYRDHWFWIEDADIKSKRTFAFLMMLFTLGDTGVKESPPLITIPAQ
jgi:hypothetical protein